MRHKSQLLLYDKGKDLLIPQVYQWESIRLSSNLLNSRTPWKATTRITQNACSTLSTKKKSTGKKPSNFRLFPCRKRNHVQIHESLRESQAAKKRKRDDIHGSLGAKSSAKQKMKTAAWQFWPKTRTEVMTGFWQTRGAATSIRVTGIFTLALIIWNIQTTMNSSSILLNTNKANSPTETTA